LDPDSPAIDAGTDVGIYTDYFGTIRPQRDGYDMGYFELGSTAPIYMPLVSKDY
jgi:hypothetical protein